MIYHKDYYYFYLTLEQCFMSDYKMFSTVRRVLRVNFLILKTCRFGCDRSGIWPLYFRAHLHAMWSS